MLINKVVFWLVFVLFYIFYDVIHGMDKYEEELDQEAGVPIVTMMVFGFSLYQFITELAIICTIKKYSPFRCNCFLIIKLLISFIVNYTCLSCVVAAKHLT